MGQGSIPPPRSYQPCVFSAPWCTLVDMPLPGTPWLILGAPWRTVYVFLCTLSALHLVMISGLWQILCNCGIMVYMNKLLVWITINLYNPHCHATTYYAQEVLRLHRGCPGCIGRALWVHPGGALRVHQGVLRALGWYQFGARSMLGWCLCAQCRRVVRSALGQR